MNLEEIIFLVEGSPEGGYEARALGHAIFTEADDFADLKQRVRDAVLCHFEEGERPPVIRLVRFDSRPPVCENRITVGRVNDGEDTDRWFRERAFFREPDPVVEKAKMIIAAAPTLEEALRRLKEYASKLPPDKRPAVMDLGEPLAIGISVRRWRRKKRRA